MNNYFKVLRPGINSTFQDLGRFGLQHLALLQVAVWINYHFVIQIN